MSPQSITSPYMLRLAPEEMLLIIVFTIRTTNIIIVIIKLLLLLLSNYYYCYYQIIIIYYFNYHLYILNVMKVQTEKTVLGIWEFSLIP